MTSPWSTPTGNWWPSGASRETGEGFAELTAMLAGAGDTAEDPIPVALETPRGLLVAALRHRPTDLPD